MNGEQIEEIKRHFGVVAEPLRRDIRQIAEGMLLFAMNYKRCATNSGMSLRRCVL